MKKSLKKGFSLTELSVVLVIIALVAGASMVVGRQQISRQEVTNSWNELKLVQKRINFFARRHGFIPCPARLNLADTDPEYGRQTVDCNDDSPPSGLIRVEYPSASNKYVRVGGIPFKVLGLSEEFYGDAWGSRYLYAVSEDAINSINATSNGHILVNDGAGNSITDKAVYVLASHGPTAEGATNKDSLAVNFVCDAAKLDGENCDGDGVFIDTRINNGAIAANFFDDYVLWQNRMNILQGKPIAYQLFEEIEEEPLPAAGCEGGVTINGMDSYGRIGAIQESKADINGDGFDDIIIGSFYTTPLGRSFAGKTFVIFGKSSGWQATIDLSSLDGSNGFVINGAIANERSGYDVSAGDINGDGYDDIVIGAENASPGGKSGAGKAFVIFGKPSGWSASFDLLSLNGANGFVLNGVSNTQRVGSSVSAAGDVNGDGYHDILIGARGYASAKGGVFVVFGKASGWSASMDLSGLNGSNGLIIRGITANDIAGAYVTGNGDINGDGYSDILISAAYRNSNQGESYIVFGKSSGWPSLLDLSGLDGSNGFAVSGKAANDRSGWWASGENYNRALSYLGDVNQDGYDDIVIGASGVDFPGKTDIGEVYIIFGKASGWSAQLNLSSLNGTNGFTVQGSLDRKFAGASAHGLGDINNDGYDDISFRDSGASYVLFGKGSSWSPTMNISQIDGSNGVAFDPDGVIGYGSHISGGDINDDGFDDMLWPLATSNVGGITEAGKIYIFFGNNTGWEHPFELSTLGDPSGCTGGDGYGTCSGADINGVYHDGCYGFFNAGNSNRDAAKAVCEAWEGQLVSIESAGEKSFLRRMIPQTGGNSYWTGLTDITVNGIYVWDSGNLTGYTNWDKSGIYSIQPDGSSMENCVFDYDYPVQWIGWHDTPCSQAGIKALCEKER